MRDPEKVHDNFIKFGAFLGKFWITKLKISILFNYSSIALEQEILGIKFKNPVGLAAGFDKNAEMTEIMPDVGFGFTEVGSITGKASVGNAKPRLWRLKKSEGLVVYYGLKNLGAEFLANKLSKILSLKKSKKFDIPVGISVAATNCKENIDTDAAILDFAAAFKAFAEIGDYITVNVSCPNADGGQTFLDPVKFDKLFNSLDKIKTKKPIFIKLSPDLNFQTVDQILDIAGRHRIDGIICTNLTKKHDNTKITEAERNLWEKGGVSGKPVQDLSDDLLQYVHEKVGNKFVLVGCGGIFTADDAYRKIRLGASLVQMMTGMIFEGPQVISEINRGLVKLLKKDGFKNIREAVGVDNKK